MKWILIFLLLFQPLFPKPNTWVEATDQYARLTHNAPLYKTSSADQNNYGIWCEMEATYFVQIILDFNESLYKVRYANMTGYVEKDAVTLVYSTPQNPYPNNIIITIASSCYLRSTPTIQASNTLTTLSKGTTVTFIGKVDSETIMDFNGPTWYLVSYQDLIGYVYCGYTEKVGTIMPNIEQVTVAKPNTSEVGITPFSNVQSMWLVLLALIPTIAILYFIYKPNKKTSK